MCVCVQTDRQTDRQTDIDTYLIHSFDGNRPNLCLLAKKLDPYTMGALLSLYEHKVPLTRVVCRLCSSTVLGSFFTDACTTHAFMCTCTCKHLTETHTQTHPGGLPRLPVGH